MRKINDRKVNGVNDGLDISVLDEPGAGGANHAYQIEGMDLRYNASVPNIEKYDSDKDQYIDIFFQNGPIPEKGTNGVTHEALLSIVADRLTCFQNGPFANDYNKEALEHVWNALAALKRRTEERLARAVEGTHQK